MEIIKTLFIPGEKILWHKVMSKDSTNERNYVITNRRIYKKHYKVAQSDFSGAPEDVLHILGDILIIERFGIKIIRSAHKLSLFLQTEYEDELYRFYPFEKINKYEAIEVKSILLDTENLLYEEEVQSYPQTYQPPYQQSYPQSYQQTYPRSYQPPSYIQDGNLMYGYQEEKKKREALERKIQYLNNKINELTQNIQFQKSLVEKSNRQLEMKAQQEVGSRVQLMELNKKTNEIEELRNKLKDVSFYAKQDLDKKNKEISSLKQNIAKLIRLHSAKKPKQESLLPEEIVKLKKKLNRRKEKLKQARIKIIAHRTSLMEREKRMRESEVPMELIQKEIPQKIPSKPKTLNIISKTKEKLESRISSSPSFSSHLKKELDQIINQAKNVTFSLNEESLDLTEELHGISNQLMKERERLIKELEVEMDSIEELSKEEPMAPITIISTPKVEKEEKSDQSRLVKIVHGRRTCPVCGNQDKYPIKEVVDKDNIISFSPRVYGKKYICGDCMAEWRQESA
ncbi:MAG: hypothetical protein ACFFAT_09390 [Promethearchaeota archaeon]